MPVLAIACVSKTRIPACRTLHTTAKVMRPGRIPSAPGLARTTWIGQIGQYEDREERLISLLRDPFIGIWN